MTPRTALASVLMALAALLLALYPIAAVAAAVEPQHPPPNPSDDVVAVLSQMLGEAQQREAKALYDLLTVKRQIARLSAPSPAQPTPSTPLPPTTGATP